MRELISGQQTLHLLEWKQLEEEASGNDPVAWNNYGVALSRSRGQINKQKIKLLFERAAQADVVASRYNLAAMLPSKFNTAPEIIQQKLALLQKNVALGDIHSMVRLSEALYFVNRDDYVEDRLGLKRSLLKTAAASGDIDYIYIYGNELWKQTRAILEPVYLADAIAAFQQVDAAGDPRGAQALADILRNGNPSHKNVIDASGLKGSALEWYARAGDLGSITAHCAYGSNVFNSLKWIKLEDTSIPLIKAHFGSAAIVHENTPEVLERAISDLKICAVATKLPRREYLPFGEPALYSYKSRGARTALGNSVGYANLSLGILYGFGIVVPRDFDLATRYLTVAAETHGFPAAKDILNALPDF